MKPEPKRKQHKSHEESEMPLDMNSSTAILDDEAPMEAAHPKKSHFKKTSVVESGKPSMMSADDTDTDKAPKKGVSLIHKGKGVEIEQHRESDKKMQKKDKATKDMKKEFKKQMDLTKNMGEEPAKPAAKVAKKTVKAEAKKTAKAPEAPKTEAPKDEAIKEEKPKEVKQKEDKQSITPAKLLAKKSPIITMPAEIESKPEAQSETPVDKPIESESAPAEEKPVSEKKPESH